MNTPTIILLSFFGSGFLALIGFAIYVEIKRNAKRKAFIKENPDYVKLRIFAHSSGEASRIKVHSVNDIDIVTNKMGDSILLPVGKNTFKACFAPETADSNYLVSLLSLIGGVIGVVIMLIVELRKSKTFNTSGEITINLNTVRGGEYELKADTYEKNFKIICLEGEKHRIETFG